MPSRWLPRPPSTTTYTPLADHKALYQRDKVNAAWAGAGNRRAEHRCWLSHALLLGKDQEMESIARPPEKIRSACA